MIKKTLILLVIASNFLHAADPAQDSRIATLFANVIRERCLFEYVDENTKNSLFCVDTLSNYYPKIMREAKNTAFSEGILQQYLTHKEAAAYMLVSKFHQQEIIKHRAKQIELHLEETKDGSPALRKIAFNDLGVHPKSVVFDASGNGACGITNDMTKIVVFTVFPYYAKVSEAYINSTFYNQSRPVATTTTNFILGASLFWATEKRSLGGYGNYAESTLPHIITYLPTGHHKLYPKVDTRVANNCGYRSFGNYAEIMFFKNTKIEHASFKNCSIAPFSEIEQYIPFFIISLPGYKKTFEEHEAQVALDELHDFSPS